MQGLARHYVLEHGQRKLVLGLEDHVFWDMAFLAVCREGRVVHPFLRQVQASVEQGRAVHAGVGQKHAGLAIGNLTQLATVLPFDPHRLAPFLREVAAINNEHAFGIVQIFRHFLPVPPQDGRIVPGAVGQKLLHPAYRALTGPKLRNHHRARPTSAPAG